MVIEGIAAVLFQLGDYRKDPVEVGGETILTRSACRIRARRRRRTFRRGRLSAVGVEGRVGRGRDALRFGRGPGGFRPDAELARRFAVMFKVRPRGVRPSRTPRRCH